MRVLQQKSMFFAYHCVYCEESAGPVFETKAAMRDHIAHVHATGLSRSAAWSVDQQQQHPPMPPATAIPVAHAKRIATFSDFEKTFNRRAAPPAPPALPSSAANTLASVTGGIVNSFLARRSAECGEGISYSAGSTGRFV